MVIQTISLLDTLDKDINSYAMRTRFVLIVCLLACYSLSLGNFD